MAAPGLVMAQVLVEGLREDADLFGDEPDKRLRRAFPFAQEATRITQKAEHQGEAEAGVIVSLAGDQRQIRLAQSIVPDQVAFGGGRIEQGGALGVGQQGPGHRQVRVGKGNGGW